MLYAIFEGHVTRLEEVLAQNEASEAMLKQDPTWMDRAAMDGSPEFERLRAISRPARGSCTRRWNCSIKCKA